DGRDCFIAVAAKAGDKLLVAVLGSHPELVVMPQDTAYFPTVLTKYDARGRRAQFDYLTKESWTNVLFGFQAIRGRQDYAEFPKKEFLATFERVAFDPANANRDLLVLMMESYAEVVGVPLSRVKRWVEKTPANRNYVPAIFNRFPKAKLFVTMRDPRALLAARSPVHRKWDRAGSSMAKRTARRPTRLGGMARSGFYAEVWLRAAIESPVVALFHETDPR